MPEVIFRGEILKLFLYEPIGAGLSRGWFNLNLTFVSSAANIQTEPFTTDAAAGANCSFADILDLRCK